MTILSATQSDVQLVSDELPQNAAKTLSDGTQDAASSVKALDKTSLPPLNIIAVEPGNKYALGGLSLYFRDLQETLDTFDGPDPDMFDMTDYSATRGGVYFVAMLPLEHSKSSTPVTLPDFAPPGAVAQDEGGVVVGMGAVKSLGGGYAEVKRMWVHSRHRRMKIASRLMQKLEDYAAARDVDNHSNGSTHAPSSAALTREPHHTMRLDTGADLHGAIATYKALGYREIPRYNDNDYAGAFFEKSLLPR